MSGNRWYFDHPYSCAFLIWVILVWLLVPYFSIGGHQQYWRKYSGSSMKFSESLWYIFMIPEFIVVDGKLWSRSGLICSNSSWCIMLSTTSLNTSSSSSSYLICSLCWCLGSLLLSIGLVWSYGSTNNNEFPLGLWRAILALGWPDIYVSTLLLDYLVLDLCLWLLWRYWYCSAFYFINNGPLKGDVSNFPQRCINTSLTYLLPSPYPKYVSLRYGCEKLLGILKVLDLYGWTLCLCTCWRWLRSLLLLKVLRKFLLEIGSIVFEERVVSISTYDISSFSKTSSVVNLNVL